MIIGLNIWPCDDFWIIIRRPVFFSFTALENLPASISSGLYISVTLPLLGHSIDNLAGLKTKVPHIQFFIGLFGFQLICKCRYLPEERCRNWEQFLFYMKSIETRNGKRHNSWSDEDIWVSWWLSRQTTAEIGYCTQVLIFGASSVYDTLSPIWWLSTSGANSFCFSMM